MNYIQKISIFLISIFILQPILAFAEPIKDIDKTDPLYQQVSNAVSLGYLSLIDGKFLPNHPLSRKDAVTIIDKLLTLKESDNAPLTLSKAELQELLNLSKNFKTYMASTDVEKRISKDMMNKLDNEQKVINADMNQLNESLKSDLQKTRQELKDTQLWTMIGGGILGILILTKK